MTTQKRSIQSRYELLTTDNILTTYFERKKLNNPKYSLRALARDLDLSASYVSQVMTGKKTLSESRIKDFVRVLELDDIAVIQLRRSMNLDQDYSGKPISGDDLNFLSKYSPLEEKKYHILSDWYNIAIMDLTTTIGFQSDPHWIAKRLGLSVLEVEIALERLLEAKLIMKKDGAYIKSENKMRLPTSRSKQIIRKFHKQMIEKAYQELHHNTSEDDFRARLITGATFAIKKDQIEDIQKHIHEKLYEIGELSAKENCDELYQLNIQFFPLTKNL